MAITLQTRPELLREWSGDMPPHVTPAAEPQLFIKLARDALAAHHFQEALRKLLAAEALRLQAEQMERLHTLRGPRCGITLQACAEVRSAAAVVRAEAIKAAVELIGPVALAPAVDVPEVAHAN